MSVFEIALIAITLITGVSIVWYSMLLGISPMPSTKKARSAMLKLSMLPMIGKGTGPIFELGSGWGNLLIPLARQHPQRQIVGYELSFLPWLTTIVLKRLLGLHNITLHRKNFLQADLTQASVIICYLYPGAMEKIESKLKKESGNLEYLISNNFSLPSYKPAQVIYLTDLYKSPVYLYQFKEPLKG